MLPYEKLDKILTAAKADKQEWEHHIREVYRYTMPERNTFDERTRGAKKQEYVFDSTAVYALEDFATRMQSELVPPNMNWMRLEAGSEIPKDSSNEVSTYLDTATKVLFDNINSSNFASQVHEALMDLGISTGALIIEEGNGIQTSLNFRAVSLSELYIQRSYRGIVETVFRTIKVTVGDIKELWSRAKLDDKLQSMLENKPETEVELVEGVVKTKNAYESVLMYPASKFIMHQEELESSPWVVFRESVLPGETYGRGRGMRAIKDIRTLNLVVEDHLKAASFIANPTFTATDDGVINPFAFSLEPGTVNAVGSNDTSNPSLKLLDTGGAASGYNILQYDIKASQDIIRRAFLGQPFGNIEDTPVRSATEMSIRNADLSKTSLGASGRIQNELLERVVERCVYILKKAGKIADFRVDGKEVAIKYTSPSARQQDEHELAAYGRFMEIMAALPPEVTTNAIKIEEFPNNIADILGLPASIKRSKMEIEQMNQAKQQQAEQLQQQAMQQQGGKA